MKVLRKRADSLKHWHVPSTKHVLSIAFRRILIPIYSMSVSAHATAAAPLLAVHGRKHICWHLRVHSTHHHTLKPHTKENLGNASRMHIAYIRLRDNITQHTICMYNCIYDIGLSQFYVIIGYALIDIIYVFTCTYKIICIYYVLYIFMHIHLHTMFVSI